MRIAICDDEKIFVEILHNMVFECLQNKNVECEIIDFLSGRELLKEIDDFDVVFLDIDMPNLDGIETGKILNQRKSECKIIIASGRIDRFKESFYINAQRFITKPFQKEEVEEALQLVLIEQKTLKKIKLYNNRISYDILIKDICYAKAYNSYVEVGVLGKKRIEALRSEYSLVEIENILPSEIFFKINRTYIVNLLKVQDYEDGKIVIFDEDFKVSRRLKKQFEKALTEIDLCYR